MRNFVVAAIMAALFSAPANAQAVFTITKQGSDFVCADLNEDGTNTTGTVGAWVMGFFSGLNVAYNGQVGAKTTPNGILGEVKLYCQQYPSANLLQASHDTYRKMRAAR